MDSSEAAILFKDVNLTLGGRLILKDISFSVDPGQFVCVLGPSGCGKTTLMRVVAGLTKPTSGEVRVFGKLVDGPSRSTAVVFQDYGKALLPWRDAVGNVALAYEGRGGRVDNQESLIAALLQKVGLHGHEHKYPVQLSGGMQQRLQIARCLAQSPSVLLMDEPFGALDSITRQGLQDESLRIVRERNTAVFFVTHDLEEAIYLSDKIVLLSANPGQVARIVDVNLPKPRNQLTSRENPEFLRLRRELFDLILESHT